MKLDCIFCRKVNIFSERFKAYVCDDCYDKRQNGKDHQRNEWTKNELE